MNILHKIVKLCDFIDRFVIRYIGERLLVILVGGCMICIAYAGYKLFLRLRHDRV